MKTWLRIIGLKGAFVLVMLSLLGASQLLFSTAAQAASTPSCSKVGISVTFPSKTFQATSIHFEVGKNPVTPTGTGAPAGHKITKRAVSDIVIKAPLNGQLLSSALKGTKIPTVTITVAQGQGKPYVTYTLSNVVVSKVSENSSGASFTLTFTKLIYKFYPSSSCSSSSTPTQVPWDITTASPV